MPNEVVVAPTPAPAAPAASAPAAAPAPVVAPVETVLSPAPVVTPVPATPVAPVVAPAAYDLKLPENSPLDQASIEQVKTFAKEKNLSNDQAQAILERDSKALGSYKAQQDKLFSQEKSGWVDTVKTLPDFVGDKFKESSELAHRAAVRYFTPEQMKTLNDSGLGNHPILVEAFYKVGRDMGDDKLVLGGSPLTTKKSAADILYDNTK